MASVVDIARRRKEPLRRITAAAALASLLLHHVHPALHAVTGSVFVAAAGAHVLANAPWIRSVARRVGRGLDLPRRVVVDAALATALAVVTSAIAVTGVGALAGGDTHVHGHLAIALALLLVAHFARHRRQLAARATPTRRRTRHDPPRSPERGAR